MPSSEKTRSELLKIRAQISVVDRILSFLRAERTRIVYTDDLGERMAAPPEAVEAEISVAMLRRDQLLKDLQSYEVVKRDEQEKPKPRTPRPRPTKSRAGRTGNVAKAGRRIEPPARRRKVRD